MTGICIRIVACETSLLFLWAPDLFHPELDIWLWWVLRPKSCPQRQKPVPSALVSRRWVVLAQQASWPRSSRSGPDTARWCFHLLVSWEGEWDVSESARLLLSVYPFAFCILIIGFPRGEDKPQKGAQGGGCHAPVFYCFRAFWAVMDFQGTGRASMSVALHKMRGWLRGGGA